MALNTRGLTAPDDVSAVHGGSLAGSVGGGRDVPAWGVGDPIAAAMGGLSKSIGRYADTLDDVQASDFVTRVNQRLDDMYNNPESGLFNTRKGHDAKGMYRDYKTTISDIWDKEAKTQLSERQMRLAAKPLGALFQDYGHRVGSHETSELMGWQQNKAMDAVSSATNLIASGRATLEDMALADAMVSINCDALARMNGWDAETTARKKAEMMGKAILDGAAAMSAHSPIEALGFLKMLKQQYPDAIPETNYQAALAAIDEQAQQRHMENVLGLLQGGDEEGARQAFESVSGNYTGTPGGVGGGGRSGRNLAANNFGNVKNKAGGFNAYASRQDGLMGIGERVLRYSNAPERGWHARTLRQMVAIYAPKGDGKNNPAEYAVFLGKKLGVSPDAEINFRDPSILAGLIQFIPVMEHGAKRVNISGEEAMHAARALLDGRKPQIVGVAGGSSPDTRGSGTVVPKQAEFHTPGAGMLNARRRAEVDGYFRTHAKARQAAADEQHARTLANEYFNGQGEQDLGRIYASFAQTSGGDLKRRDALWKAFNDELNNHRQVREIQERNATTANVKAATAWGESVLAGLVDEHGKVHNPEIAIRAGNEFLASLGDDRFGRGDGAPGYQTAKRVVRELLVKAGALPAQNEFKSHAAFQDAKRAVSSGLMNAEDALAKYGWGLSEEWRAQIAELERSEDLKRANRQRRAFFNEMVVKSGLDSKNDDDREFLAEVRSEWEEMLANGEFKSPEEQKGWIYEQLAKRVKPGRIWDSNYTPRQAAGRMDVYLPVPPWEVDNIVRQLARRGIYNPTPQQIQDVYNRQRGMMPLTRQDGAFNPVDGSTF